MCFTYPEIGYNYKVITIKHKNIETVYVHFFTLKTRQIETDEINIKKDTKLLEKKISERLSSQLANKTFEFLINQVLMKREARDSWKS